MGWGYPVAQKVEMLSLQKIQTGSYIGISLGIYQAVYMPWYIFAISEYTVAYKYT